MDFIEFLNTREREILTLIYKAKYSVEEDTPLCLLGKKYFGFLKKRQKTVVICTQNAKDVGGYSIPKVRYENNYDPTKIYINRALRHEAVHVAQGCNNGALLNMKEIKSFKFNTYKNKALEGSTLVSGSRDKEKEAYLLEDKPKIIIIALKKYCRINLKGAMSRK
tara:strand:- start:1065 stop:1559 length:495 start_codon:yes stop_codon:yes gene_type:complete